MIFYFKDYLKNYLNFLNLSVLIYVKFFELSFYFLFNLNLHSNN